MYRALVTDLDGTAVAISSNGDDIDESTRLAVSRAILAGMKLTCATGRDWELAQQVIKKLGLVSPCIIEGGTRIVDPATGKSLWEKDLGYAAPAQILAVFRSFAKNGLIMHSSRPHQTPLSDIESLPDKLRYLYLIAVPEEVASLISSQINMGTYGVAHCTPSWHGHDLVDVHVTHPQATKKHAIAVWQELEGVSKAETIGLGDSGNDIPIFQSAEFKVAVASGTPNLKSLADYIGPAANEHALEHVINKFLLHRQNSPGQ